MPAFAGMTPQDGIEALEPEHENVPPKRSLTGCGYPVPSGSIALNKRDIVANQTRKFSVVLEPEPEGGFTVRVLSLPEIVTYGKDETEASAMAEDAIRLVLEDCIARGEPIPTPSMPHIREVAVTLAA